MPRAAILEIRFKTKTLLPCKEKRRGMTDDEAAERSAQLLVNIGRAIRDEHKMRLGRRFPPASSPGEYPARRTGSLKNGIYSYPEKTSRILSSKNPRVRIGYSNKNSRPGKNPYHYGPHLVREMARLGIIDTINSSAGLLKNKWKPVTMVIINHG